MIYERYLGENLPLCLEIDNEPDGAVVTIALVKGHMNIVATWSSENGTLAKGGSGEWFCELSPEQSAELLPTLYVIEAKCVSASGCTIAQVGQVRFKTNKVYEV